LIAQHYHLKYASRSFGDGMQDIPWGEEYG
jgi:hypothetical protein